MAKKFIGIDQKKIAFESLNRDKFLRMELSRKLTHAMLIHTEEVFDKEGPGWTPLKAKTRKQRVRQGFGEGPILDRHRGWKGLRRGIIEAPTSTKAIVGVRTGILYALIHQIGGVINRVTKPGSVWLRTTGKKGKLKRQKGYPNLAVFKKKKNKLGKEVKYEGGKQYQIVIPQRKYLFFSDDLLKKLGEIASDFLKKGA